MESLNVSLRPSTLAVLVGLIDIAICELFKMSMSSFFQWRFRFQLHQKGYVLINLNRNRFGIQPILMYFVHVAVLVTAIWLELSISGGRFPSASKVLLDPDNSSGLNHGCFGPKRDTRAFMKGGPESIELNDDRISLYLKGINCKNRIISNAVAGSAALQIGYPSCTNGLVDHQVNDTFRLQGSGIAHVANSDSGDPHLAYGLEKHGNIVSEDHGNSTDLAPTSFISIVMQSQNKSTSLWKFNENVERVVSNLHLPENFLFDSQAGQATFNDSNSAIINCVKNGLSCYHDFANAALNIPDPIHKTYSGNDTVSYIFSHRSLPSFVCVLDKNIQIDVWWVYTSHYIPDATEREVRSGPTLTRIQIQGRGKCVLNMSKELSRLYLDAMEDISLRYTMQNMKKEPIQSNLDCALQVLQTAAVLMGMKTKHEDATKCFVNAVTKGSSMGKLETYVASAVVISTCLITVILNVLALRYKRSCPLLYDPLDIRSILGDEIRKKSDSNVKNSNILSLLGGFWIPGLEWFFSRCGFLEESKTKLETRMVRQRHPESLRTANSISRQESDSRRNNTSFYRVSSSATRVPEDSTNEIVEQIVDFSEVGRLSCNILCVRQTMSGYEVIKYNS